MMERRRLLELLGVGSMIGEISHYKKISLTFPNAQNSNPWERGAIIPCDFPPKFLSFSGGTDQNSNIINGCYAYNFDPDDTTYYGAGAILYRNPGNNRLVYATSTAFPMDGTTHNVAAARSQYYNGNIYINRVASDCFWSNTDTYTFEIYG